MLCLKNKAVFLETKKKLTYEKKPTNIEKIFDLEAIFEPETLENETRRF